MKKTAALLIILFLLAGCGGANEAASVPKTKADTGAGARTKAPHTSSAKEKGDWVRVARVIDGDTFEFMNRGTKEKVRLIGVDTPESAKPGSEAEPFGIEAGNFTKKMIEGKLVRLEFDIQERDKHGRLLCYVYLEDGSMLNTRLLEEGLAAIMTVPPNVRMADNFLQIQRKAREQKKGIWR